MILICNIYKEVEMVSDLPYVKIMNVPYNSNISLYKNIGVGGIELEDEIFKYDSAWGENQKHTQCMVIWDSTNVNIEKIIGSINQIRPDEIYLESLKPNFKHSWIYGHKNSIVTFASAIMAADTLKLNNKKTIHKNIITWLGNRIGLNLFEI